LTVKDSPPFQQPFLVCVSLSTSDSKKETRWRTLSY